MCPILILPDIYKTSSTQLTAPAAGVLARACTAQAPSSGWALALTCAQSAPTIPKETVMMRKGIPELEGGDDRPIYQEFYTMKFSSVVTQ